MASHGNGHADHFDLLPFIAILMCVLACLLLVTMSIAALSIGPSAGEGWVPTHDPNKLSKTPILVEWDGTNAIIHRETGSKLNVKWDAASLLSLRKTGEMSDQMRLYEAISKPREETGELEKFLSELSAKSGTHYALLAVRPSGFDTFTLFAAIFRFRKIDIGYEPIKQEKSVRLLKERK